MLLSEHTILCKTKTAYKLNLISSSIRLSSFKFYKIYGCLYYKILHTYTQSHSTADQKHIFSKTLWSKQVAFVTQQPTAVNCSCKSASEF